MYAHSQANEGATSYVGRNPMKLVIQGLNKTFTLSHGFFSKVKGHLKAVNNVSFEINAGESLGIVGESGSGKTTISKILAGFMPADSGSAFFGGHDLLKLGRRERSHLVQMVFQDPFASLNPKLLLGTQLREVSKNSNETLMTDVGLPIHFLNRYPHQLSGGQRQRFAIARALAAEPKLLLADEPVSSLDISVQAQIINLLNELRQNKKFTQILISHDLAVIANTCDHVLVMKDGIVVESGAVDQVLQNPQAPYTQRLIAAVPVL